MNDFLVFAQNLAKRGGEKLTENFGKLKRNKIQSKGAHDLVTVLDKEVEQMYVNAIKKQFPDHGIIGEEGSSKNEDAEYVWILDPLDGTRNYTIEVPFYATTICLLKDKEPVVTVIYVPPLDKLYSAAAGQGAFLNGQKIHVSNETELIKSSILYCHSTDQHGVEAAEKYAAKLKMAAFNADRFRSAGAEMGMVAEGLAEAYLLDGLPVWDLAAGALLIREAGGKATDFSGRQWKPGDKNILVSNGTGIHWEILKILASVL
ncbi:MAG: inositol monophosphatase family protein [Patescibacteria group bacterium]|nr:inositol monophosphatase [Patescibacteria group bacterium]MBU1015532.1 inositol monophosphatase [Patescibacteria group bacterium]MBU1685650.1 inositol monophosphatase [Patescibacteria group bacterium]MBU1938143.1 inositol monophosphatase [Patescibacteria group bacterium]